MSHVLHRLRYRIRQLLVSLRRTLTIADQAEVQRWLSPQAAALFAHMTPRDQQHSLDVLRRVQDTLPSQPALYAAALLHDVAKTAQPGRRIRLWHRVLVVILTAFWPAAVPKLASADPQSWRYPFFLHLHHPALGAQLATAAGCDPLTIELIRYHQDKLTRAPANIFEQLLAALQAADDAS